MRAVLLPGSMPCEVKVLHDRDVVLTELFQEEWMAEKWAHAYAGGLKELGFREVPTE